MKLIEGSGDTVAAVILYHLIQVKRDAPIFFMVESDIGTFYSGYRINWKEADSFRLSWYYALFCGVEVINRKGDERCTWFVWPKEFKKVPNAIKIRRVMITKRGV